MNNRNHLDATEILNISAILVEQFGEFKFENDKTLKELFNIEDISFWDLFTSELAQTHLPIVLSSSKKSNKLYNLLQFTYSRLKSNFKNRLLKFKTQKNKNIGYDDNVILCLGFTNQSYKDILVPIVNNLSDNSSYSILIISDKSLPSIIESIPNNCSFKTIWEYLDYNQYLKIQVVQKKINKIIKYLYESKFIDKLIPVNHLTYKLQYKKVFKWLFFIYIPNILAYVIIARHVLYTIKPKIILTPDSSDPKARSYTIQAGYFNIPSLSIQFGLLGEEAVEWRFLSTDMVAVWGEFSKRALLNHQILSNKINITGSPRYDYKSNSEFKKNKIKKSDFNIDNDQKMILLASSYSSKSLENLSLPNTLDIMKKDIFSIINNISNCVLVIKPHPSENIKHTKSLYKGLNKILIVEKNIDIRELIDICDIFISFGSTATIDALVLNKIAICPVYPGWTFSDYFKNSGSTLNPTNKEDLKNLLYLLSQNIFDQTELNKLIYNRNIFLEDQIFSNDSRSTNRIEELIYKMLKV